MKPLLTTPQDCAAFAMQAHDDQVDKQGLPYFYHPLRVGSALYRLGPEFAMAGFLHDVVEDTDYTLDDLREFSLPEPVVLAVESVTSDASGSDLEAYEASLLKAMADPIGRLVKAADVSDNGSRLNDIPWGPVQHRLRTKYEFAEDVIRRYVLDYRIGKPLYPGYEI